MGVGGRPGQEPGFTPLQALSHRQDLSLYVKNALVLEVLFR